MKGILQRSLDEWEDNYRMVLHEYERQKEAYDAINELKTQDSTDILKLEAAINEWGDNYAMIIYEYER